MKIIDDLKSIDLKNMDLKNTQTQFLLLTIFAIFAVGALYIYFVFVPQVKRVFTLNSSIPKVRSELKSSRVIITDYEKLKNKLKEQAQKVESYEKKLPAKQEIPALLESLSNMAKDSGTKIIGIVPAMSYFKDDKSAGDSQIYKEIPILITAKSGYHELGRFLSSLENSDRFMKVVDISIQANKEDVKRHDVELMVCTYTLLTENK
jgi:type IV pilus assembly protein PilO